MTETYDIRQLDGDDVQIELQRRRLGWEAFGEPDSPADRAAAPPPAPEGAVRWGAFRDDDLVAKLTSNRVSSWWGGAEVPTAGIGGVTVALEHRGEGLLSGLFGAMLVDEERAGTGVSTLFPTAAGIYRRFGYELIGSYDAVEVPVAALAGIPPASAEVSLRRASEADVPAIAALHRRWATTQNGPLTRTGPGLLPATSVVGSHTAVTLAVEQRDGLDRVVGVLAWQRGQGYGQQVTLEVSELIAETADAHRALWRALASQGAAVGTVRLRTSGQDVARTFVPTSTWKVVHSDPYALRVVDLPRAVSGRRTPVSLDVEIAVAGDTTGGLDGAYRLRSVDGHLQGERIASRPGLATYAPRGLAIVYAGAQSSAAARAAGLLSGPEEHDDVIDAAFGGRPVHVRDYF